MMRTIRLALTVTALVATAVPILPARERVPQRDLGPGDMAPDFSLVGSDGKTYRLSDYRGKQAVILAWFAKANSAG